MQLAVNFFFFKKSKESAISLCEDGTLPLVGPRRCLTNPDFVIVISIKEKDSDREVCGGRFSSGLNLYDRLSDKPLRLVFRGDDQSFGVPHMNIFSEAGQASINVALVVKEDKIQGHLPAIHGKLVARYTEEEYDDEFYRIYFPTVLFSIPKDEPKVLSEATHHEEDGERSKQFKIQLPRSVVAVPTEASLFIETDLDISFQGSPSKPLNRVCSFATIERFNQEPLGPKRIYLDNGYGYIEVKVDWVSYVSDLSFDGP